MSHHVLPSNIALAVVLLVLTAILYLFPGIVAVQRDHRHAVAILVFDLFLGWTFLGWDCKSRSSRPRQSGHLHCSAAVGACRALSSRSTIAFTTRRPSALRA